MGYIYQIVDTQTHEYYLGKSQNANHETDNYWGSGHNRVCRAAKKANGSNPRYQKIVLVNNVECHDKLAELEKMIIGDLYETDILCLNLKAGGWGGNISEESKAKISAARKGKQSWLGKSHSEESKAKISAARKGKIFSEETRAKMSEAQQKRRMKESHICVTVL
jgi:hypothetical protein